MSAHSRERPSFLHQRDSLERKLTNALTTMHERPQRKHDYVFFYLHFLYLYFVTMSMNIITIPSVFDTPL